MNREPGREVMERLALFAGECTGFSMGAIQQGALVKAVRPMIGAGITDRQLLRMMAEHDERLVRAVEQAVVVGETYFCRHPEHFEWLAGYLQDKWSKVTLRAWSAGCATGEEAYSLSACLLANRPASARTAIDVLGTDLLARNVRSARQGVFGSWSVRVTQLFPLIDPLGEGQYTVREDVRMVTRFEVANLLYRLENEEPFDVIFCRNVLVYFSPAAAAVVYSNLASLLAKGGVIVFGTMDVVDPPAGLRRIGPPDMQIFVADDRVEAPPQPPRGGASQARQGPSRARTLPPSRRTLPPRIRASTPPSRPAPPPRPLQQEPGTPPARNGQPGPVLEPGRASPVVSLHIRALELIERGQRDRARDLLTSICERAPDYLPALLERALQHNHDGEKARAQALMKQIITRTRDRAPTELVEGPESLPLEYYRTAAEAFLSRRGRFA